MGLFCLMPLGNNPSLWGVSAGTLKQELKQKSWKGAAHWPKGWPHSQCSGPFHINNQSRKCTTGLHTGQYDEDIFSIEVSSSLGTPAWVKLTCSLLALYPWGWKRDRQASTRVTMGLLALGSWQEKGNLFTLSIWLVVNYYTPVGCHTSKTT